MSEGAARELLAPCGLYCGVCAILIADRDDNPRFKERLTGVYNVGIDEIHCKGCLSGDLFLYCRVCPIRDCTMVRNDDVVVPVEEVMKLAEADIRAGNIEKSHRFLASMEELAGRMERVEREHPAAGASPPLDGNQLMEMFDMGPGPWIGEVKRYLEDLLVSGELSPEDVEGARERSRRFMRDYNSS